MSLYYYDNEASFQKEQNKKIPYKEGDRAYIRSSKHFFVYKEDKKEWFDVTKREEQLETQVNLYEWSKNVAAGLPPLSEEGFNEAIEEIDKISNKGYSLNRYMILCKELSYYTIFEYDFFLKQNNDFKSLGEAVLKCVNERYDILLIEPQENGTIEVWVRTRKKEPTVHMMLLFNCEDFIVSFGGQL